MPIYEELEEAIYQAISAELQQVVPNTREAARKATHAVAAFLGAEHYVTFTQDDGFYLEHALDCRIKGMLNCQVHKALTAWDEAPLTGRYKVVATHPTPQLEDA